MSNAELLYTYRDAYPQVIERAREQVSKLEVYRDGALAAPTEAGSSYELLDPGGTSIATPALTVVSSVAQVTLTAALLPSTLSYGEGYQERWTLVLPDGTTRVIRRPAALAKFAFYPVVADVDLEAEYPDLSAELGGTISSWQGFRDQAWKHIVGLLRKRGHYSYVIYEPTAFRDPHRHRSLYLVFKWLFLKSNAPHWESLMNIHLNEWRTAWADTSYTVDLDQDGISDGEARTSAGGRVIHRNSAPRRTRWKSTRW